MKWVAHVDRVLLSAQLLSEITLLREFQFFADRLVSALNYPQANARHVVRILQLRESGASESQVGGA